MRYNHVYAILIACFLGVCLQVAARAVPAIESDGSGLVPRGGKFPSLSIASKPPISVNPKPVGGVSKPPAAIRPNPVGNSPKTPVKACKRADSQICDLNDYSYKEMARAHDDLTAFGHIKWAPAEGQELGISLNTLAKRLWTELEGADKKLIPDNNNLLAALYVPERGIFLSTTPRYKAAEGIIEDWKDRAPGLYRATGGQRVQQRGHKQALHVEDGVIYRYELMHPTPQGKLPSGSTVAIYGSTVKGKDPNVVPACSGGQRSDGIRFPACSLALNRLGIGTVTRSNEVKQPKPVM
ncbi:hypothetical protein BDW69DRAFT_188937 [Aspergillus filifer]